MRKNEITEFLTRFTVREEVLLKAVRENQLGSCLSVCKTGSLGFKIRNCI